MSFLGNDQNILSSQIFIEFTISDDFSIVKKDVRTYELTDNLYENSDHYRAGLLSASWINAYITRSINR